MYFQNQLIEFIRSNFTDTTSPSGENRIVWTPSWLVDKQSDNGVVFIWIYWKYKNITEVISLILSHCHWQQFCYFWSGEWTRSGTQIKFAPGCWKLNCVLIRAVDCLSEAFNREMIYGRKNIFGPEFTNNRTITNKYGIRSARARRSARDLRLFINLSSILWLPLWQRFSLTNKP